MMLWLLLLQVWASCLWLGHSEVVTSFESSCPQFFFRETPPNEALEPENPAWICQRYNNQYFFATLYDRKERIPVYSAYIYEPGPGKRPQGWLVEPQLINDSLPQDMYTVQALERAYNITRAQIMQSQAVSADYENSGWDRGHLNPNGHHNTLASRNATFTLTNIVPMNKKLNRKAWKKYEQQTMRQKTKKCQTDKIYVIVGAVPGNSSIAGGRVNVPSHIWSGACCKTKNNTVSAWAAIANNKLNRIWKISLGQLEKRLGQLYGMQNVSLFHSDCPRNMSLTSWA
ncbi:PREDICTED: endonuclease domain-containing 1 protein-like isoform X1 [Lepidothrix coronata]|uniref:Endonuclease domain-containing 1 protein-like isoform X1 n=1 Tax=Lepidothrix coronata TaxID=321398 RepID=A0A6J0GMQ5_9PASS|nr:PREDICTED: endonuclease domain-containing 1 protein-like isoform X1 [Lepidothrix coronata]XP_017663264.1 PREDICTED: endonuclease domain-containing 1 protein-like isoform X1 [Lepidothrix coronata]